MFVGCSCYYVLPQSSSLLFACPVHSLFGNLHYQERELAILNDEELQVRPPSMAAKALKHSKEKPMIQRSNL